MRPTKNTKEDEKKKMKLLERIWDVGRDKKAA